MAFKEPRRLTYLSAWNEHLPFAMMLVQMAKPRILVELGTHSGVSYCAFCQAVADVGCPTRCFAVDTWEGDSDAGFYGPAVLSDLRQHHDPLYERFSTLLQTTFDQALHHFEDKTVDILHIDGLHSYEAVKHDFQTWEPKLSDRAVVLFHDTAVRDRGFGVHQFWEEISAQRPAFLFTHGNGLGVLGYGDALVPDLGLFFDFSVNAASEIRAIFEGMGCRLQNKVNAAAPANRMSTLSGRDHLRFAISKLRARLGLASHSDAGN